MTTMYLYSSSLFKINILKEIDDLGKNLCYIYKYLVYNPETNKARVDIITPLKNPESLKFRCGNKYKSLVFKKRSVNEEVAVFHELLLGEAWISGLQGRCFINGIIFIYGTGGRDYHTGDFFKDEEFRLWENYMNQQVG